MKQSEEYYTVKSSYLVSKYLESHPTSKNLLFSCSQSKKIYDMSMVVCHMAVLSDTTSSAIHHPHMQVPLHYRLI